MKKTDEKKIEAIRKATDIDPDMIAEICRLELEAEEDASKVEALKERLKNARAAYDDTVDEMRQMIRSLTTELPLFDRKQDDQGEDQPGEDVDDADDADDADDSEDWEVVHVSELDLTEAEVALLTGQGIETLGGLTQFEREHKLTEIKGLGSTKAARIEAAVQAFWDEYGVPGEDGDDGPSLAEIDPADAEDEDDEPSNIDAL